jgi:glutamine amidotransferase
MSGHRPVELWRRSIVIHGRTIVSCGCTMVPIPLSLLLFWVVLTGAGSIGGFDKIKRTLMNSLREEYFLFIQGGTDSEWAFAVFLSELANLGVDPSAHKKSGFGHATLRTAMMNTIALINGWCKEVGDTEPSLLNFAVTDGHAVVASRYVSSRTHEAASLFFRYVLPAAGADDASSGTAFHEYQPGHFRMERQDKGQDIVLVASEPLTFERADWVTVPTNCTIPASSHLLLHS